MVAATCSGVCGTGACGVGGGGVAFARGFLCAAGFLGGGSFSVVGSGRGDVQLLALGWEQASRMVLQVISSLSSAYSYFQEVVRDAWVEVLTI